MKINNYDIDNNPNIYRNTNINLINRNVNNKFPIDNLDSYKNKYVVRDNSNNFKLEFHDKTVELITKEIENENQHDNISSINSRNEILYDMDIGNNYVIDVEKKRCLKKKRIQKACNNNLYICFFLTVIICILISYTLINLTNTLNNMKLQNLGSSLDIVGEKLDSLDTLNKNLEKIIMHIDKFSHNFNRTLEQNFVKSILGGIINENGVGINNMNNGYIPYENGVSRNSNVLNSDILDNNIGDLDTNTNRL